MIPTTSLWTAVDKELPPLDLPVKENEMTVADLIEFLQGQPQDIPVAYDLFSEQCLLSAEDIRLKDLCEPREDGWIQNKRPDKPTRLYLVFPGN